MFDYVINWYYYWLLGLNIYMFYWIFLQINANFNDKNNYILNGDLIGKSGIYSDNRGYKMIYWFSNMMTY